MTRIAGVASAFPRQYYRQEQITEALRQHWDDGLENPKVLDRLLTRVGVEGRYLALPIEAYDDLTTWGKSNDAWIEIAEDLAEQSICGALTRAGLCEADLDAIFFVSVTGVASPSIDARLMNRMNLRPDIKRDPIFGLGCVAGAAGLARAADYVRAFPKQNALCWFRWNSARLHGRGRTSRSPTSISSGLFGDGSAAVIVARKRAQCIRSPGARQQIIVLSRYRRRDGMGHFSEEGSGSCSSTEVPDMVRKHLAPDVDSFLSDYGLHRTIFDTWIMHTGGPKVLEATAESLDLPDGALDVSWQTLRRVGNLSSASVLLVLEEFINRRRPATGSYSILAAMGPGFCSELVLLRW